MARLHPAGPVGGPTLAILRAGGSPHRTRRMVCNLQAPPDQADCHAHGAPTSGGSCGRPDSRYPASRRVVPQNGRMPGTLSGPRPNRLTATPVAHLHPAGPVGGPTLAILRAGGSPHRTRRMVCNLQAPPDQADCHAHGAPTSGGSCGRPDSRYPASRRVVPQDPPDAR